MFPGYLDLVDVVQSLASGQWRTSGTDALVHVGWGDNLLRLGVGLHPTTQVFGADDLDELISCLEIARDQMRREATTRETQGG